MPSYARLALPTAPVRFMPRVVAQSRAAQLRASITAPASTALSTDRLRPLLLRPELLSTHRPSTPVPTAVASTSTTTLIANVVSFMLAAIPAVTVIRTQEYYDAMRKLMEEAGDVNAMNTLRMVFKKAKLKVLNTAVQ